MYSTKLIWENSIEHFNNFMSNKVTLPTELVNPNTNINIQRGADFRIEFELITPNLQIDENLFDGERKVGEVFTIESEIELNNETYQTHTLLKHIHVEKQSTNYSTTEPERNFKQINGYLDKITSSISTRSEQYSFDWLLNMSFDKFTPKNCITRFLDDSIDFEFEIPKKITLGKTKTDIRNSFKLKVLGSDIIIGQLKEDFTQVNKKFKAGFIFYTQPVEESHKDKIREALSFLLGRKLVYIGNSRLTTDAFLVGYEAITPYIISDRMFNEPSTPPCEYTQKDEQSNFEFLNYSFMENFIEKFVEKYDDKNLEHIMWMYWHSLYSPIHSTAGSLGAIIEFILSTVPIEKNLIPKQEFKAFRIETIKKFEKFYAQLQLQDSNIEEIVKNKINDLNKLPISKTTERAFQELGIEISPFEKKLWQRRHDSAHGNLNDGDMNSLIRDVHAFQSLCNRTILMVLDLSNNYIDYYNYDYPVSCISEPITDLESTSQ